jgi:hypothetical protein
MINTFQKSILVGMLMQVMKCIVTSVSLVPQAQGQSLLSLLKAPEKPHCVLFIV